MNHTPGRSRLTPALVAMGLLALAPTAQAALQRIDFTGTITSVSNSHASAFFDGLFVGDSFEGSLVYDDAAPSHNPATLTQARFAAAVQSFALTVGARGFAVVPSTTARATLEAQRVLFTSASDDLLGGLGFNRAACNALPCFSLAGVNLESPEWHSPSLYLWATGGLYGDSTQTRIDGSLDQWRVTAVTPVPEPASAVLAALGGLALWAWRQRRVAAAAPESKVQHHPGRVVV